jgi:hypothetical protein
MRVSGELWNAKAQLYFGRRNKHGHVKKTGNIHTNMVRGYLGFKIMGIFSFTIYAFLCGPVFLPCACITFVIRK